MGVLGYGLWQRTFGGDPAIVGRSIRIDGVPTEVLGAQRTGSFLRAGRTTPAPARIDTEFSHAG